MEAQNVALLISATSLVIIIAQHLFGGGWRLSAKLSTMQAELQKSVKELKDDIDERSERHNKDYGATAAAIRQRVHELELHVANNFMRRDSFYQVNGENAQKIEAAFKRIDTRLERMEEKIDKRNA